MYMMTESELQMLYNDMTDGQREIFMTGMFAERQRIIQLIISKGIQISSEELIVIIKGAE